MNFDGIQPKELPYSNQALALGIISVAMTWIEFPLLSIIWIILGIFTLRLTRKSLKIYAENPDAYKDVEKVKIAKILAIIAIVWNAIVGIVVALMAYILYLSFG